MGPRVDQSIAKPRIGPDRGSYSYSPPTDSQDVARLTRNGVAVVDDVNEEPDHVLRQIPAVIIDLLWPTSSSDFAVCPRHEKLHHAGLPRTAQPTEARTSPWI